jgi:hypothetical protein
MTPHRKRSSVLAAFVIATGLLVPAWGCAGILPGIDLDGRPVDLQALVGTWSGEYSGGAGLDRRGRITFSLSADGDVARGCVDMVPRGTDWRFGANRLPATQSYQPPAVERLTIRFVRVDEDTVMGTLDEYWDPDRLLWLRTMFFGRVRGNVIEGSFRSKSDYLTAPTFGTWRVKRVSATAHR